MFAVAATSILSLCGSPALADEQAKGTALNAPDTPSGSNAQASADASEESCGVTAGATATLNHAFGHACADGTQAAAAVYGLGLGGEGGDSRRSGHGTGDGDEGTWASALATAGDTGAGATIGGPHAAGSSGVGLTDLSLDPCQGAIGAVASTTETLAAVCADDESDDDGHGDHGGYGDHGYGDQGGYGEDEKHTPKPTDEDTAPPAEDEESSSTAEEESPTGGDAPSLAETGAEALAGTAAASAALIAGGVVMYRRSRRSAFRG